MIFLECPFFFYHTMMITIENIKLYSRVPQDCLSGSSAAFVVPMDQERMAI